MPLLYEWLKAAAHERASDEGSGHALVYRDTYLSWRGLAHRVDRRAQDLQALGVGPGSWVGVMLGNVPDFVILALALSRLRAVLVPLDPTTSPRDLDMILEVAPLRALVTRPRGGDSLATTGPGALRVGERPASLRHPPESRRRLQGTLLTCNIYRREPPALAGITPAAVLFTLDAGGDPKGVVRTEAELAAIAASIGQTLEIEPRDRVLCTSPLHHGYAFDFGMLAALAHRATLYLDEETVVSRLARAVREGEVDVLPANPATYGALARLPTARPVRRPRARFISSGSALAPTVAEAFHERYGVRLINCYHSTEAGPIALDRQGRGPATAGKPFAGVELQVATADRRPLPAGTTGPVWVRSGGVAARAVPELALRGGGVAVGRTAPDGWFRTGDLGHVDRHGRLLLTGREDDLVKIEGRRVALGEVEAILEAFAAVREAQARVIIDELGGPRVVARVVPSKRCRPQELIDHCARNLAPHKVPRAIELCERLGDG